MLCGELAGEPGRKLGKCGLCGSQSSFAKLPVGMTESAALAQWVLVPSKWPRNICH